MFETRTRGRNTVNIWPGFVDILATLLMVFVFVLTIFMVAQHYLSQALAGRTSALQQLQVDIQQLADMLALERTRTAQLGTELERLKDELVATVGERDRARQEGAAQEARAQGLAAELAERERELADARERLGGLEQRLAEQGEALAQERDRAASAEQRAASAEEEMARLNRQIAALRDQLARLESALEVAETTVSRQQVKIEELGQRLNVALASKVQELQRYRSEFFGRLRAVLGERPDVRIVGDRFVFQSELFFESASAELGEAGKRQLAQVAQTLKELAAQIPQDIDWVLQVEGHTDVRPIRTEEFPSNWELSTARANSIVHFLIEQGIPPQRLAAAGFAEFQPVDRGRSEEAFRRNRRIELKFTSR
jgi:chemotaxis protein MotB